jgi:hypothetical protein
VAVPGEMQLPYMEKALIRDNFLATRTTNFARMVCISANIGNLIHVRFTLFSKLKFAKFSVGQLLCIFLPKMILAFLADYTIGANSSDTTKS